MSYKNMNSDFKIKSELNISFLKLTDLDIFEL